MMFNYRINCRNEACLNAVTDFCSAVNEASDTSITVTVDMLNSEAPADAPAFLLDRTDGHVVRVQWTLVTDDAMDQDDGWPDEGDQDTPSIVAFYMRTIQILASHPDVVALVAQRASISTGSPDHSADTVEERR